MVSETKLGTTKATPTDTRPKTVPGKLTETFDDCFGIMRDAQTAKHQSFSTGDGRFPFNLGRVYTQQQALNSDTSPAAQGFSQSRLLMQFPEQGSPIKKTKRRTIC